MAKEEKKPRLDKNGQPYPEPLAKAYCNENVSKEGKKYYRSLLALDGKVYKVSAVPVAKDGKLSGILVVVDNQ